MNSGEIVAYIGAAAWLPQIFSMFYKHVTRPKLRLFFNNTAEISHTSFGPIFNIRIGMLSEKKSLLLDDITLEIKHSDGDIHLLKWAGITEVFSEINDQYGNKQVITKDQPPIALNLPQDLLTEKFIKFQEPNYYDQDSQLLNELNSHINFLISKSTPNPADEALESTQAHNLLEYRKNYFWWKKGEYTVTFKAKSPDSFQLESNTVRFKINQTDIDLMKFNLTSLNDFLNAILKQPEDLSNIKWNWVNPKIIKD